MLLREILEAKEIKILSEDEAKEGHTITIRTPFIVLDRRTKNDRTYSKALMQREVKKVQTAVESGSFLGMGDHPSSGFGDIKSTSHIVEKLELDEKSNTGYVTLKILDTPMGKIAKTIIREGGKIGVSMRGFGDVINGRVQNNYILKGLDLVCDPSVKAALFGKENILESINFDTEEVSEEYILDLQKHGYAQAIENYNCPDTFEEWMKTHGAIFRAVALVEQFHLFDTVEEALKSMGETELAKELNEEDEGHVYTPDECYVEAHLCNVDPKVMAERLNLAEERKKIDRGSDFSLREAQALISEAESAGMNLSDPTERKKFLEKMSKMPTHEELTLHERSLQIQENLKAKGTEATLETIQRVLIHEDKQKAIKERQIAIENTVYHEAQAAGAKLSNEQFRKIVNRLLKQSNLPILEEE